MFLVLLLTSWSAFACPKFFHPIDPTGTAFAGTPIKFNENEWGPQLDGLKFKVEGKETTSIFYSSTKKRWCGVVKMAGEVGGTFDCNFLHTNKAGILGSGQMIEVSAPSGKVLGYAIHTDNQGTLTIFSIDPSKSLDPKSPSRSVDRKQAQLVLSPKVDVGQGNERTVGLEVSTYDVIHDQTMGRATHSITGELRPSGELVRRVVREAGPPAPKSPLETISLAGSDYQGPSRCGFGTVGKLSNSASGRKSDSDGATSK
ncbi:MAG: hypothetical protein AB7F86_18015 [Bdellovibrionales bacterium]